MQPIQVASYMYVILLGLFVGVFCKDSYRAAVVQLATYNPPTNYVPFIKEAKSKRAEIVVFPEAGVEEYFYEMVEVGSKPCGDSMKPVQSNVSCSAEENEMYVVFQFVEHGEKCEIGEEYCIKKLGYYVYNTAVVVNRTGHVILKYRKYHPVEVPEKFFKPGPPVLATFKTDFGVEFGVFICYDIVWKMPAGEIVRKKKVNNILFPIHGEDSGWVDSTQQEQGYSEFYGVNLLASNDLTDSRGSGIFSKGKPIVISREKIDALLIADVPIFPFVEPPQPPSVPLLPWKNEYDFHNFTSSPGKEGHVVAKVSSHICTFTFKVKDGIENFTIGAARVQKMAKNELCMLINCGNHPPTSPLDCWNPDPQTVFEYLEVSMTTFDDVVAVYPYIGSTDANPIVEQWDDIKFVHDGSHHSFQLNGVNDPISFAYHLGILNVDS